jgi:hypothetical protein
MRELLLPQASGPSMTSVVRCPGSPGIYVDLDEQFTLLSFERPASAGLLVGAIGACTLKTP